MNEELVGLEQVTEAEDIELLQALIRRHLEVTGSSRARRILDRWQVYLKRFWKVAPKSAPTEEGAQTVVRRHLETLRRLEAIAR